MRSKKVIRNITNKETRLNYSMVNTIWLYIICDVMFLPPRTSLRGIQLSNTTCLAHVFCKRIKQYSKIKVAVLDQQCCRKQMRPY